MIKELNELIKRKFGLSPVEQEAYLVRRYGLPRQTARVLIEHDLADYFEATLYHYRKQSA
jgi:Asp-tRNA(Asn)/Glu-tRNA(Gln) amidotransferase B subunit